MSNPEPIVLTGCSPEPLMSYLKALGIFRIVAEQLEPEVRACWEGNSFILHSRHPADEIAAFFLDDYSPAPIVAPWNGGSGFYEGDQVEGIQAILNSKEDRFKDYRETINAIHEWDLFPPGNQTIKHILRWIERQAPELTEKQRNTLMTAVRKIRQAIDAAKVYVEEARLLRMTVEKLQLESKDLNPAKASKALKALASEASKTRSAIKNLVRSGNKNRIILACRDRLSDRAVDWLDAVAVIDNEGEVIFPPLLGSGGNEGRLDYTNNFMSAVSGLLLTRERGEAEELLMNALFGKTTSNLTVSSIGQYDPGRAGGFNQGTGVENKNIPVNPWDFVLAMEGCLVWAASLSRRKGISSARLASIPFTVRAQGIGYGSAAEKDDETAKAEIWAPLWGRPATCREFRKFIGEGRADSGRRPAANTLEFAEAIASLSVDRGVGEFVRYSLIQRRGQSNIALPAGRFPVRERRESDLVRELRNPLYTLDQFLRQYPAGPPGSYSSARRAIDRATYEVLLHGGPSRVKTLLAAIGRMESLLARRDPGKTPKLKQPIAGLSAGWLEAADDGSVEFRIAAALASITRTGEVGPIRSNLAPVDPHSPWQWASSGNQVAWSGPTLSAKMAGVLERRMLTADQTGCPNNPTHGLISLHPGDVMALLEGTIDEAEVEDLLFGLTWLRWNSKKISKKLLVRWRIPVRPALISRAWALLKLNFWPEEIYDRDTGKTVKIRPESGILALLRAGRTMESVATARRRLFVSGLNPVKADFDFPLSSSGIRLAASLLVPVLSLQSFSYLVLNNESKS